MSLYVLRSIVESRTAFWLLIPVSLVGAAILAGIFPFEGGERSKSPKAGAQSEDERWKPESIRGIAVSEDGEFLDVAEGDAKLRRRDTCTGQTIHQTRLSPRKILGLQLSGQELWTGLIEHRQLEVVQNGARLWEGKLPGQQTGELLLRCSLNCSHRQIAVVSDQGSFWLLDYDEDRVIPRPRYALQAPLSDVGLSPAGKLIVLITSGCEFWLWDIQQERIVVRLPTEGDDAQFAAWSGDGRRLATFGRTPAVAIWDAATGQLIRRLILDSSMILTAELSFDGTQLAVGDGKEIRLWDLETGTEFPTLIGHESLISVLHFADRGRTLFSGDTGGNLRRWSMRSHREIWAVP